MKTDKYYDKFNESKMVYLFKITKQVRKNDYHNFKVSSI